MVAAFERAEERSHAIASATPTALFRFMTQRGTALSGSLEYAHGCGDLHLRALLHRDFPNGVSYEVFQTAAHPGWDSRNETICKTFAQTWYEDQRSALLIVPRRILTPRASPIWSRCGGTSGFTGGSKTAASLDPVCGMSDQ